jgi:hypothetical protein
MGAGSPRLYDLAAARPEGWFDEVLKQSPDFERACQIIGRSTLGLALIAGARIASLTPSATSQSETIVEFSIGPDDETHQVSLPEFRDIVAQYLSMPIQSVGLPEEPEVESLQAHIGGRYMLAASLFQVKPLELRHELGLSEVALEFNGVRHVLSLEDFREVIDERVRAELGLGEAGNEVAIDLALVDQAERANENGEWGTTIALLAPWLNPISMLMRTGEAEELADEVRGRLSHGLDLLGTAFANAGDLNAANEVLRLGVQWAGESSKAGDLFFALGRASIQSGKHGEAIGLLRRAIGLGVDPKLVTPMLAESLHAREQTLAAMVCLEEAKSLGADESITSPLEAKLTAHLADTWQALTIWLRS